MSCGPGGERARYRLLTQTTLEPGDQDCQGENSQTEVCPFYPCPQSPSETPRTSSSPSSSSPSSYSSSPSSTSPYRPGVKRLLGEFEHPLHGVSGKVYLTPKQDKILIEDFTYDGRGPDAFFWVGSEGSPGARSSVVLPHPFTGQFYDRRDPEVPRLPASYQEDLVLSLPPHLSATDIKWISVWCRKWSVDFGHVIVEEDNGE